MKSTLVLIVLSAAIIFLGIPFYNGQITNGSLRGMTIKLGTLSFTPRPIDLGLFGREYQGLPGPAAGGWYVVIGPNPAPGEGGWVRQGKCLAIIVQSSDATLSVYPVWTWNNRIYENRPLDLHPTKRYRYGSGEEATRAMENSGWKFEKVPQPLWRADVGCE